MVRCIVKSCSNRTDKCCKTEVSFFNLPKNEVIREGWLRKIEEVNLPSNLSNAKICSVYFTEQSFHVGRRQKSGKCTNLRQLLLLNAFPTVMLSPTENRTDTVNMDFKVIRREFLLTDNIHRSTDRAIERSIEEGSNNNEEPVSKTLTDFNSLSNADRLSTHSLRENINPDLLSVSETVVNVETPKSHIRRKSWIDERRIFETPQNTSDASNNVCNATFPQRFMMENYNVHITDNAHKSRENEEPYIQMKLLKAELEHYRSLNKFHLSRCNNLDEIKEIEKECETLRLLLVKKNEDIKNLTEEKEEMKAMINDLQAKLIATDLDKRNFEKTAENKMIQILQCYFTKGQIRCIIENRKWIQWSIEDYASAISFRSISPKAYRYFRFQFNFPLPSLISLRRWALKKFDIREGFLSDVLAVMREKGKTFTSLEKITVLTFDEITVNPEVQFDSKIEKLIGPCSKVQVIMTRGLFANWKQPIYYKFDQPMTKSILIEAVRHLHDAGYEVVATTSDMGNKGVWGELQIIPENHFFEHPVLTGGKIFVFADVPHLLKLLRNWFIDESFLLEHCSKPFTAKVMQAIIDMGNSGDLRVAHRLTQQILDARHSMRQAVKPAAQIWSHTVAKAIKWAGDCGLINLPDYKKFSDFVSTVNKWFDVHNSQLKYDAHP